MSESQKTFFKLNSETYDSFNLSKDYKSECEAVLKLLEGASCDQTLLDFGCGTGKHLKHFINKGFKVTGVDLSKEMIEEAEKYLGDLFSSQNYKLAVSSFENYFENEQYDLVTSMYSVLGYVESIDKLSDVFENVTKNLKKNGRFVFDVWNGPCVISEGPLARTKIVDLNGEKIQRRSIPKLNKEFQNVEVLFEYSEVDSKDILACENHIVHYFFEEDISKAAEKAGLQIVKIKSFPELMNLKDSDWNAVYVLCKK